jgi:hypothetical protein
MSGHHPKKIPKLSNEPNADTVIKNVTVLCASKILGLFNIFPARFSERVQGPRTYQDPSPHSRLQPGGR